MNQEKLDELKKVYQNLSFIHNKLLTTAMYLEEFPIADAAMKWLTAFANGVAQEIEALTPKPVEEVKSVEVGNG